VHLRPPVAHVVDAVDAFNGPCNLFEVTFHAMNLSPRAVSSPRDPRFVLKTVARPAGFEPTTYGLEGRCSIH
jgi:hypothetical protein